MSLLRSFMIHSVTTLSNLGCCKQIVLSEPSSNKGCKYRQRTVGVGDTYQTERKRSPRGSGEAEEERKTAAPHIFEQQRGDKQHARINAADIRMANEQ